MSLKINNLTTKYVLTQFVIFFIIKLIILRGIVMPNEKKKKQTLLNKLENKMFIKYSQAGEENFDEINSVLEQTFKYAMETKSFEFHHYSDFIDNLKEIAELGGKTFVVKYRSNIVGTVSFKPREIDKPYYSGAVYELCHLAVLPEYQKKGMGVELVKLIQAEADSAGVPIILSTPEKNVDVARFYERYGFHRVRMFKAGDHYAIRFFKWNGECPYTAEWLREEYKKSALLCLMKNYEICNYVADEEIRSIWKSKFYKYMKDEPAEVRDEMRRGYRKKGTTPKRFVALREKKDKEQENSSD